MNREQIKRRLEQLAELRKAAQKRAADIIQASLGEGRAQTAEEQETITSVRAEVDRIDAEVKDLLAQDKILERAEDDAAAAHPGPEVDEARAAEAAEARKRATVKVGREPLTYEQEGRSSYVHDLVMVEKGIGRVDRSEAEARLRRHADEMRVEAPRVEARMFGARPPAEIRSDGERRTAKVEYEKRDLDRTDGSGGYFVPPLWMMEDYIDLARSARTTADLCRRFTLPAGTDSINIPKVATGTATGVQTADNAAVTETDLTDTSVVAPVRTIAGQQDISLQAFEQSPLAFDQVILADLSDDHATRTNDQVLNGSAASGQVRGIRNIASVDTTTYTDASPTLPELYPKIADSWQQIASTRYRIPEVILMTPTRWAWWESQLGTDNRPLLAMAAQGPQNSLAEIIQSMAQGLVGQLPFGPVVVDPGIPTNLGGGTEDVIILTRPSELYLWEGPLRTRVLTEVLSGNLTVRLQVYNYVAFMPDRRPESTSIVAGTGLIAPTF